MSTLSQQSIDPSRLTIKIANDQTRLEQACARLEEVALSENALWQNSAMREILPKMTALTAPAELTLVIPTFNESANLRELIRRVEIALADVKWEMIIVDDNSPDGTAALAKTIAQENPRIRCIRRVNRRGLAGACIEGMLASSAPIVAVMDGDLQHDESILPEMLARVRTGSDLAVGSRHIEGGSAQAGFSTSRAWISQLAGTIAKKALKADLSDMMSGFFMVRRSLIEDCAPKLSPTGFKILADLVASAPKPLALAEVPYNFRERFAGESKFDAKVGLDFLGLILNKISGGRIPQRFIFFALVGATGVGIHMATLKLLLLLAPDLAFKNAQTIATFIAMTSNFFINNSITYRNEKLRSFGKIVRGLLAFYAACLIGAVANIGVADWLNREYSNVWLAALTGVCIGAVWNYSLSSLFVWRKN